ncbi:3-dehydroquinate synthase [Alkaliphilus hydrothermalis]|uniref:3-dehydroquinate synthase n=1 Tax=Alkaliphilus hydrothermalis TaxID=1482730 RepID=A0ABS2NMC4_9FIRM|nr:3-dehydroquinate synthase [Alkaliphilus hydrothermalis]MBM7613734.1 3-dehydroquinate synthase [Alkaliphilus hydrothermalis]
MERLYIDLGKNSYWIEIGEGLLGDLKDAMGEADQWLIITDDVVDELYGVKIHQILKKDFSIHKYVFPSGEGSKNIDTVTHIINFMLDHQFTRHSKIIALGGGVVGDIAGFCASIYMRGIDFLQVPTTLLAQVDSSVGGKTGVNMPQGKNLVGSFYQPQKVIIDTETLKTLSPKEILSGVGEVIKYGIIYDYNFFNYVRKNDNQLLALDHDTLKYIIYRCCQIKAEIVSKDEKEKGLRKILNFGHTFGHALEAITQYGEYTHGEAVLIGMYYEAKMAKKLGLLNDEYYRQIRDFLQGFQKELINIRLDELIHAMKGDKKNLNQRISFIFPTNPQEVKEVLLSEEEVRGLLEI